MTPDRYPDPRGWKIVSLDIETKDPKLTDEGNGVYRNDGKIVGVSIDNGEGFKEYYNLGHYDGNEELFKKNREYLARVLALPVPKLGTNIKYDLDWLINWAGFRVEGPYIDILIAEALLNEYSRGVNNLDSLAVKYLGESKGNAQLLEYCAKMGWTTTKKKGGREHIHKMPYTEVRSYALADVDQPLRIFAAQKPILIEEGLMELFTDVEMALFPLLLKMRRNGVRLNETGLISLGMNVADEIYVRGKELSKMAGFAFNPASSKHIQQVFDTNGYEYNRNEPTEAMKKKGIKVGNPSFNKASMKKYNNPFCKKILDLKHLTTIMGFYLKPWPSMLVKGRLHCNFISMGFDDAGTVSGRFSSNKPNLQQVSSKEEEENIIPGFKGQVLRKLFIPEDGCKWLKIDWSQIEYRLIAHYAQGAGSEKIRSRYTEDPNTDYHQEMMEMTGIENRKDVKGLNFGTAYSMGWRTMSETFGWPMDYAQTVYNMYHMKVPFIKHTSNRVAKVAEDRGHIKTILKRRARLRDKNKSYVMFNRLIQGSAADLMKLAMVQADEAGLFGPLFLGDEARKDFLIPHLTVHDELDCSMPDTEEGKANARELKEIMETCIELKVPIIADAEVGDNWGELSDFV